ncbi:hypothetical protein [Chitinimonas arctica]|uniref:hypothetical protein n=1 Tax=Chitinimonas arctica TaxID=2594795 RepID=UPI001CC56988|nr:hypothetical protein [Chitinimonas arctica]
MLRRYFGDLLQRVVDALADDLRQTVRLADQEAALPGFHIYLPHPAFGLPVATVHRDLQHRDVFTDIPAETERDGQEPPQLLSFTLSLSTPPGSGLAIWPSGDAAAVGASRFLPYRDGELLLHDGLRRHQAVLACTGPLERITLQGHGIRRGPHWLLYW